jgi:hypothetical protein
MALSRIQPNVDEYQRLNLGVSSRIRRDRSGIVSYYGRFTKENLERPSSYVQQPSPWKKLLQIIAGLLRLLECEVK